MSHRAVLRIALALFLLFFAKAVHLVQSRVQRSQEQAPLDSANGRVYSAAGCATVDRRPASAGATSTGSRPSTTSSSRTFTTLRETMMDVLILKKCELEQEQQA